MIIKGTKVSNGYAIGKVKIIDHKEILVSLEKADDVIVEFNRVKKAVQNVVYKIEQEKDLIRGRIDINELRIFDAHILMAQDPEILSRIKIEIEKNHESAEYTVNKIFDNVIESFHAIDNEYFRQRAEDVIAIKRKILCELLEIEEIEIDSINDKVIIVSNDLTPSQTARLNKDNTLGFVTETGGMTSHSAIMAKSLEIPAVLGVKGILSQLKDGDQIIVDAVEGQVIIHPSKKELKIYQKKIEFNKVYTKKLSLIKDLPTSTLDDHKIDLNANISHYTDFNRALEVNADGIGLFRTEFLYMDRPDFPSEEEQFLIYKEILQKLEKRVVIRTLDIGGDKQIESLSLPREMNPFLGLRAIRLSFKYEQLFKTQMRALLRASVHGELAVMFPMITTIDEIVKVRDIVETVKSELKKDNIEFNHIEIGMMIETPGAAIMVEKYAKYVDFFSIGTNDLIQYTLAADRMNEEVSYLYQPLSPAILRLIKMIVDLAHKYKRRVSVCGEMASDKYAALLLIGLGVDALSMTPSSLLHIKDIILSMDYIDLKHIAQRVLMLETEKEIKEYLVEHCDL